LGRYEPIKAAKLTVKFVMNQRTEVMLFAEVSALQPYDFVTSFFVSGVFFGMSTRVVNPGIPDDFGIVKSRDLNFGIFGYILIRDLLIRIPALPGLTSLIK
jgi:hypothetical protein